MSTVEFAGQEFEVPDLIRIREDDWELVVTWYGDIRPSGAAIVGAGREIFESHVESGRISFERIDDPAEAFVEDEEYHLRYTGADSTVRARYLKIGLVAKMESGFDSAVETATPYVQWLFAVPETGSPHAGLLAVTTHEFVEAERVG